MYLLTNIINMLMIQHNNFSTINYYLPYTPHYYQQCETNNSNNNTL